eukprot:TRINITY_DN1868_c0_g1_i4.p1 TRINITY_DN1868_c0_g1~~TRINITY_DN1868_c0_g1_i4.p1  ORF type:complete len:113 (-),score=6.15 TRINITY_DN1868_c0_g1_i4:101-439(-)
MRMCRLSLGEEKVFECRKSVQVRKHMVSVYSGHRGSPTDVELALTTRLFFNSLTLATRLLSGLELQATFCNLIFPFAAVFAVISQISDCPALLLSSSFLFCLPGRPALTDFL